MSRNFRFIRDEQNGELQRTAIAIRGYAENVRGEKRDRSADDYGIACRRSCGG